MTSRMRKTRSQTGQRRSHHALTEARLSTCDNCGAKHLRHRVCEECGKYRGKEIIDTTKKLEKKMEKAKAASESEA